MRRSSWRGSSRTARFRSPRCRATTRRSSTSLPACPARVRRRWRRRSPCSWKSSSRRFPAWPSSARPTRSARPRWTLEFDQGRDIDAAAVDVQAALLRAQRQLPIDMTVPPSYRKVNPADAPVLLIALTSPSLNLSDLNDYAEHMISPSLSTLEGVAQVNVFGQKRFAVRVRVMPEALTARNISLDELNSALKAANVNTPVGTLDGAEADADAAGEQTTEKRCRIRRADRQQPRRQLGAPARRGDGRRQLRDRQDIGQPERRDLDHACDPAPAGCEHGQGGRRSAGSLAGLPGAAAAIRAHESRQRPFPVDPRGAARRHIDDARNDRPRRAGDLPVPAPIRRHGDPDTVAAGVADRARSRCSGPSATRSTTSRCSASRSRSASSSTTRS